MNHLFFVRYEPKLMMVDCLDLSVGAELAHRRLCDYLWIQGVAPTVNERVLQQIARVVPADWPRVFEELQQKGWHPADGRLRHHGALRTLQEAQAAHASAVERGAKGAHTRRQHTSAQTQLQPGSGSAPAQPQQSQSEPQSGTHSGKRDERLTRTAPPPKSSNDAERQFMTELKQTLEKFDRRKAKTELDGWGGWWRNRFREDPDKARRILADLRTMITEHRIKVSPGAAANDLWARLP